MISTLTTAARRIEPIFTPEDQWVESARKIVWQAAQRVTSGAHTFVREKNTTDYITTADASAPHVARALYAAGYQRNLTSTVKYRTRGGQKEWIHSAWVYDPEDTDWQHDVFIWERDGVVDVYGHREPSVRHPAEHLDLSTGVHGDPNFRARGVLKNAGIDFSQVDTDTLK